MGKGSRLGDRPYHGDGTRIIRSRIGARAVASPAGESVTSDRRRANRNSRSTILPSAAGTYSTTSSRTHRQIELTGERRCVGRVLSGRDRM